MNKNPVVCNICGSNNFKYRENEHYGNLIVRCLNCGLVFGHPQPDSKELKKIYGCRYFNSKNSQLYGYDNYLGDKENILKTFRKRMAKIEKQCPKKGRAIDLGCATGFFLEMLYDQGWQVFGVELSDYASALAKEQFGNNIFEGMLSETNFPERHFDLITAWDYLEHVPEPKQELAKINSLLKDDGLLVLSTPDINSIIAKIMKNKWMGFKDIEHLYYFSADTLQKLMRQSGFKIIKTEHIGKYISFDLFIKRLSLYSKSLSSFVKFILPEKILNKNIYVNPLDIICVYAKKL